MQVPPHPSCRRIETYRDTAALAVLMRALSTPPDDDGLAPDRPANRAYLYLAQEPVDMRTQYDGLWALASQHLELDPKSGALFVFANKARDRVQLLHWDGTGVWVLAKHLEQGRFTWPATGHRRPAQAHAGAGRTHAFTRRHRPQKRRAKSVVRALKVRNFYRIKLQDTAHTAADRTARRLPPA